MVSANNISTRLPHNLSFERPQFFIAFMLLNGLLKMVVEWGFSANILIAIYFGTFVV